MTATAGGGDTVAAYWASVVEASNSTKEAKRERALELLRLKEVADDFRATYLPELPAITINTAQLGPRASGKVDSVGSWGQGISILLRPNRVDPFETSAADAGLAPPLGEPSLAFGHPLKRSKAGESLRKLEAELLVIQQLVRAYQHLTVERKLNGWGAAESDLKSYGGNGSWYAAKCNEVWRKWCAAEGLPFVPVRHSRQGYEAEHPCISEELEEDQDFSWLRPSCSGWPMAALAQARDPRISGPAPVTVKVGNEELLVTEEQWMRWCLEDQRQAFAAIRYAEGGNEGLLANALDWPEGQRPEIDEVDGEQLVKMPVISKPIQTSARVNVNYDAADALQTMEALLAGVDLERGTELWPTFLQLANDHPKAPGASRVQMEIPTPLKPGEVDLAAVIAAQFNVPTARAAAVVDRVALFLNPPPEPVVAPAPVVITEESAQSELRKQRKPRTVMSKEAEQALAASIREHLAMDEPPYGWKSALARQYGVTASVITQRINALEVA